MSTFYKYKIFFIESFIKDMDKNIRKLLKMSAIFRENISLPYKAHRENTFSN